MGWPRKNDNVRIYQDKDKSYFIVYPDQVNGKGMMDALANVHEGSSPTLCGCGVSPSYIYANRLKRQQWSDLPENWKIAFNYHLSDPPENIRGFWKVNNQPKPVSNKERVLKQFPDAYCYQETEKDNFKVQTSVDFIGDGKNEEDAWTNALGYNF